MRLIVNADDFGLTPGVNRGIIEAHRKGIVTSSTMMANGAAFEEAVALARENPRLGIGCHLVAIGGKPVLPPPAIRDLVGADGRFPTSLQRFLLLHPGALFAGWSGQQSLAPEFAAQVERIRQAGLRVSHLDSHKHLHALPGVREAVLQVAREKGIPYVRYPFEPCGPFGLPQLRDRGMPPGPLGRRMAVFTMRSLWAEQFRHRLNLAGLRSADATFGIVHTGSLSEELLEGFLNRQYEVIEICCHPGYDDPRRVFPGERLRERREREVAILTDPGWRARLKSKGVELTNYVELAGA